MSSSLKSPVESGVYELWHDKTCENMLDVPQQVLLCVVETSPCLLLFCLWHTLEQEIPKIVFYQEGSPGNFTKEEEQVVKGLDSERP